MRGSGIDRRAWSRFLIAIAYGLIFVGLVPMLYLIFNGVTLEDEHGAGASLIAMASGWALLFTIPGAIMLFVVRLGRGNVWLLKRH